MQRTGLSGFKSLTLSLFIASMLSACSGSSGDSDTPQLPNPSAIETPIETPVPGLPTSLISGIAIKGVLHNALITAYPLDKSEVLASTFTDETGAFSLPEFSYDGPVLLELTSEVNTRMRCDASVGCGSNPVTAFAEFYYFHQDDFILSAILPVSQELDTQISLNTLHITPITHLAAQRSLALGLTDAALLAEQNALALKLMGIQVSGRAAVDVTNALALSEAGPDSRLHGLLASAFSYIAETDASRNLADVINEVADDYAQDGGLIELSSMGLIDLHTIFLAASKNIDAIENQALSQGQQLDLDYIETRFMLAIKQGKKANLDEEFIPSAVEPLPTDAARAELYAAELLEQANRLHNKLVAAQVGSLTQPFIAPLTEAGDVLDTASAQSNYLQSIVEPILHRSASSSEIVLALIDFTDFLFERFYPNMATPEPYSLLDAVTLDQYILPPALEEYMPMLVFFEYDGAQELNKIRFFMQDDRISHAIETSVAVGYDADSNSTIYTFGPLAYSDLTTDLGAAFSVSSTGGTVTKSYENPDDQFLKTKPTTIVSDIQFETQADGRPLFFAPKFEFSRVDTTTGIFSVDIAINNPSDVDNYPIYGHLRTSSEFAAGATLPLSLFSDALFNPANQVEFQGGIRFHFIQTNTTFNGKITTDIGFYDGTRIEPLVEPLVDKSLLLFDGVFKTSELIFTGVLEAHSEKTRTPSGDEFVLDGKKHKYLTSAIFNGQLSPAYPQDAVTYQLDGAATRDISGLTFTTPDLPAKDDVIARISYGLRQINTNHLQYFIDYADATTEFQTYADSLDAYTILDIATPESLAIDIKSSECVNISAEPGSKNCIVNIQGPQYASVSFDSGLTHEQRIEVLKSRGVVMDIVIRNNMGNYNPVFDDRGGPTQYLDPTDDIDGTRYTVKRNYLARLNVPAAFNSEASTKEIREYYLGLEALNGGALDSFVDVVEYKRNATACVKMTIPETEAQVMSCDFDTFEEGAATGSETLTFTTLDMTNEYYEAIALGRKGYTPSDRDIAITDCRSGECDIELSTFFPEVFHPAMSEAERNIVVHRMRDFHAKIKITGEFLSCETFFNGNAFSDECNGKFWVDASLANVTLDEAGLLAVFNKEIAHNSLFDLTVKPISHEAYSPTVHFIADNKAATGNYDYAIETHYMDMKVTRSRINFLMSDYETADAYVETSANTLISADLPELLDTQAEVFIDRIGLAGADLNVQLKDDQAEIRMQLSNILLDDSSPSQQAIISNDFSRIEFIKTCKQANLAAEDCLDGFNYTGEVFVGAIKIADLEQTNNDWLFTLPSGEQVKFMLLD